jgi:Zn-dependent protease with chaperone function
MQLGATSRNEGTSIASLRSVKDVSRSIGVVSGKASEGDLRMAIETAYRFEQISPKAYEHPADRAATSALHSVPLLDKVVKRLSDLGYERRLRQMVMGNALRLGADQVTDVWASYTKCTVILDLEVQPDLYMMSSPIMNAMAIGAKTPMIVVNSSLIGSYSPDEIQTVLGHEVAHVLSEHNYYTTALLLLKQFMEGALPRSLFLGLPVRGMYFALLEWARAAELSCDRAAALVMGDPMAPCGVLMRLAGGSVPGMELDAFLRQATEYHEEDDLFSRHTRFWAELNLTHPVAVRRVKELTEWEESGEYDRIRGGDYPRRGLEPPPSAEFSAAVAHYAERFSRFFDRTAGNVQDLGKQLGGWLKKWQSDDPSANGEEADAPD